MELEVVQVEEEGGEEVEGRGGSGRRGGRTRKGCEGRGVDRSQSTIIKVKDLYLRKKYQGYTSVTCL